MKAKVIKTGEIVEVYHEPQHGQITNIYKESVLVNSRMWTEDELNFCVKANEAPENIYISPAGVLYKGDKQQNNDIEYVRKDAFIEKALEFLDGCIPDYIDLKHANVDTFMNVDNKRFIEDFRKYMEGE